MARNPNILLIISDQHRRDWIGCEGFSGVRTPAMDRLAATGTRFNSAYCPYPLCGPSRMAFMTGRFPHRLGMYINEHTLRSDVPTFAHALGAAGYETVLAGRMHFSGVDQRHGFHSRLTGDMNAALAGGLRARRDTEPFESSNSFRAATVGRDGLCDVQRFDLAVARDAEHFLEQRARTGEDRPLLMVAGLFQPHHPFVAPPELVEKARERLRKAGDQPLGGDLHPAIPPKSDAGPSEDQALETRAVYAAMIEHLDGAIAQILAAAESHLSGPTLVIYTSDHGEMAGDFGLWGKTVMLEPSAGIPLIFAPLRVEEPVPGLSLEEGRISSAPVSLLDIGPTLANLAGAPPIPACDGRDLTELLRDPAQEHSWREQAVFSELCIRFAAGNRLAVNQAPSRLIRKGPWKLVYYHPADRPWREPCTLHNLEQDPDEQRDLTGDPRYAEIRAELLNKLLADWDPEAISQDANERAWDLVYTQAWAAAGGAETLGYLENWSPHNSTWHYGFPGQPAPPNVPKKS